MYQHVLVALDGSPLSEAVLPHVEGLASVTKARLLLLRAVNVAATVVAASGTDGGMVAPDLIEQAIEGEEEDARAYLTRMANQLKASGQDVTWQLVESDAARAIVETAHREGCDLIALATHGRSGLQRAVLGSVADEVVRESHLPVLLVRPPVAQ
jgi:nucleotide-binding universal stress UspA family protein